MPDLMLTAHTLSSGALVIVCWWLAHQNALLAKPPARIIALGFAWVSLTVLVTAFLRFGDEARDIWIIASKVGLTFTFCAVSWRRHMWRRLRRRAAARRQRRRG
ncbi:hypothetical protein [Limimaricola cinnabarinus]|uniref:Uncharacterized protein n=1 Tax=Limimaricola cinnabarinus TaxID=1125964 RepID=A0A2G1MH66_9RHOB|nr:hypothetical protein [Limimaricola cinnabarinus]PHP27990.1 hypothetical protein CJ301_08370 [Limimaricola cinnabarinus]